MWSGSTTSKTLALGMAMVAQRAIGTIAGIYYTNMPEKCIIEGRIVNQHTQYCVRILHKNCGSFIEGKYSWKRISKNESYGTGTVFNISVEDDESYIANGAIVHNCQDISAAGKGKGIKGERSGLWTEFARIISEIQPSFVFLENSPMLLQRGIEIVLGDLSCLGYNARWGIISASDAGFNHLRKRFWCLGYSSKIRFTPIQLSDEIIRPESLNILSSRIYSTLIQDEDFSRNFRNDDGMANWVERFAAIGNGQVPAVVELAWKILNSELKPVQSIAESKHKNKLPNKIKKHNFGKLIKQGE
jgi:site-specific DNA-cytosine methylase